MDLLISTTDAVTTLEFNRPAKKNALTNAMYQAMADAIAAAESDAAVRVLVIRGQPEVFTAGNDIEDFLQRPPNTLSSPVLQFMTGLAHAKKPVVAAVRGPAVGIGTTMLLHCDLVYADESAAFLMPFVSLGIVPEFGSSFLLPAMLGHARAAELLLLGERFGAAKAHAAGIVTAVVADPVAAAESAAKRLAALPASSVRAAKALLKRSQAAAVQEAMREESEHFRRMLGEPAAREALAAFLEKRKPVFTNL